MQVKTLSVFCFNMCILHLEQIINNALICIGPKYLLKIKVDVQGFRDYSFVFFTIKDIENLSKTEGDFVISLIIL